MAALLRRGPAAWRSTQFSQTLSLPPTNHFASGASQSSTFFQGSRHTSSLASRAQNFFGLSIDSCHSFLYSAMLEMRALAENALLGLKMRSSTRWLSMVLLMGAYGFSAKVRAGSYKVPFAGRDSKFPFCGLPVSLSVSLSGKWSEKREVGQGAGLLFNPEPSWRGLSC